MAERKLKHTVQVLQADETGMADTAEWTYWGFQRADGWGSPSYQPAPDGAHYLCVVRNEDAVDLWWVEDRKTDVVKLHAYYREHYEHVTYPFTYQLYPVLR